MRPRQDTTSHASLSLTGAVPRWVTAPAPSFPYDSTPPPSRLSPPALKLKASRTAQMRSGPRYKPGRTLPDLHKSARKHFRRDRLDDEAVHHAAAHVLHARALDEEDDPRRWLVIGSDPAGRLLELVVLVYDDGYELVIHAMKARPQYLGKF